ncbi:MAG: c-type cytochrome [Bryobacteraceae bacterium]
MTLARWAFLFLGAAVAHAEIVAADSTRGARLFETQGCIECHSVNGKGGHVGPDLGRRVDRDYTPATLASLLWNHAPAMWTAMRERGIHPGDLNEQAAADLFAYFYSVRFFEKPGDAGRGKRLFEERHCAQCHGLAEAKVARAKPISQWNSLDSPIALVNAMWNHAADMGQELDVRKLGWIRLSAQDLTDILVYLRNLPSTRQIAGVFRTTTGQGGKEIFLSSGCAGCHTSELPLAPRLKHQTLTGIAAEMWNHEPRMTARHAPPPHLELEDMRVLVSYLWARQFFEDSGDAIRGKRVFAAKKCSVCHGDPASGAPSLARGPDAFTGIGMVSALWQHGPAMLDRFPEKKLSWPRFDGTQMSDLIAYLNTREAGGQNAK